MQFDFRSDQVCCFTGHRQIPDAEAARLWGRLLRQIRALYLERGYTVFLCGGAVGFDQLAAEAVLALRETYPAIRLYLFLPFPGYDENWSERQRLERNTLLKHADGCLYAADAYHKGVYYKRDRMMVNLSSVIIAYLQKKRGGAYYTASFAYDSGLEIINLAKENPTVYNIEY